MEQIERIQYYEEILDEANKAVSDLSKAIEQYETVKEKIVELESYYGSNTWRRDYEDDEAGKLPADLKRGVLSQDAVYDMLTKYDILSAELRKLANK
ncbi:MAG: DUF4298 domain-containing protein [Lachnospiraceae bacterium]|nr:DUF4298 domain-containing protein [Lachnospiraceae bacterium]